MLSGKHGGAISIMKMIVRFEKDGAVLTSFAKDLEKAEDFREANDEAFELFSKENPGVFLFDGVTVVYDRAD